MGKPPDIDSIKVNTVIHFYILLKGIRRFIVDVCVAVLIKSHLRFLNYTPSAPTDHLMGETLDTH